jgi:hypothetical protein
MKRVAGFKNRHCPRKQDKDADPVSHVCTTRKGLAGVKTEYTDKQAIAYTTIEVVASILETSRRECPVHRHNQKNKKDSRLYITRYNPIKDDIMNVKGQDIIERSAVG